MVKLTQEQRRDAIRWILNSKFRFDDLAALKRDHPQQWRAPSCDTLRGIYGEAIQQRASLARKSDIRLLRVARTEYDRISEIERIKASGFARIEAEDAKRRENEDVGIKTKRQRSDWARKSWDERRATIEENHRLWEGEARNIIATRSSRMPSYRELARLVSKQHNGRIETIRKHLSKVKVLGK